ncbi:MAG: cellulase family glycosylhydrolase [Myxococcota bacterium]
MCGTPADRSDRRGGARRLSAWALAGLVALFAVTACDLPHEQFITDEKGRALILHGTNLSSASKSDPNRLPSWLTRDDALRLSRDWGFNFVRYLIFWDAVEPTRGDIDETYLDAVEEYLDWLHEAGVRVVLDMHQDVYSSVFCCDGAPEWAVRDDGIPFEVQSPWFANYFQPAVMRAWDNFFDADGPHSDLQVHYAAAWAAVAARFRDHPAVLGYDIMNEPSPGTSFDLIARPNGPMPAFERDFYAPFLQRVIDAIRSEDSDSWIFFEPTVTAPASGFPSYLPRLSDPRSGGRRLVYFPHLYSASLETGGGYDPSVDRTVVKWASARAEEVERHGTPILIGEFGATDGPPGALEYLEDVLDMADRMTSGWTVWDYQPATGSYSFIDSARNEKAGKLDLLVRAYPRAVAGRLVWYQWAGSEKVLLLFYREVPGVDGPTEIAVPATRHFPGGFEVRSSDRAGSWSWTWDADREIVSVHADRSARDHLIAIVPTGYSLEMAAP